MSERRALSKRLRFQVFARDDFTCVYCGRHPPAVTLEVDHIIPVVEGGTNEAENLVASCFDCNRGKAANPLSTVPPSRDLRADSEEIREREAQLRAYNEIRAEQRRRRDEDFTTAWNHWFALWDETELPRWHVPWEGALRNAIEVLGVDDVVDAMDVTRYRFDYLTAAVPRYFGGVIRNKLNEVQTQ